MASYSCIAILDVILLSAMCYDKSRKCLTWKNESWFTEYCSGRHKDLTEAQFGGTTLGEACKHSCGLCPGNIEYIYIWRIIYKRSTYLQHYN